MAFGEKNGIFVRDELEPQESVLKRFLEFRMCMQNRGIYKIASVNNACKVEVGTN
jgi:hypothetical protein